MHALHAIYILQSIFSLLPLLDPSSHYFFHYFYYYFRYHQFLLNDHTPHDPCYKFPVINFLPPWSSNSQLILSFSSSMIFEVFLLLMNNYKTKPLCSYYFSLFSNHLTIALISLGVHWPHTQSKGGPHMPSCYDWIHIALHYLHSKLLE